jgi:hypothetical protein
MVELKKQQDEPLNLTPQYWLNILVYSKDRPYQLSQFLESFFKLVSCEGMEVCLNILYTYTPNTDFEKYYDQIKLRFSRQCKWHLENGTID